MYELYYSVETGKVVAINCLSKKISIPLCEDNTDYQDFLIWNKAQKTPLDLSSTIPVIPPEPVRDLAQDMDELKARVTKLEKK
jgi:hypothetical protein